MPDWTAFLDDRICLVRESGRVVKETRAASEPERWSLRSGRSTWLWSGSAWRPARLQPGFMITALRSEFVTSYKGFVSVFLDILISRCRLLVQEWRTPLCCRSHLDLVRWTDEIDRIRSRAAVALSQPSGEPDLINAEHHFHPDFMRASFGLRYLSSVSGSGGCLRLPGFSRGRVRSQEGPGQHGCTSQVNG